jgi:hypothetical protein
MLTNYITSLRRSGRRVAPRSARDAGVVFAVVLLGLVAACGSGSSGPSPSVIPTGAPDVPAQAPPCSGALNQRAYVRADLVRVISACTNAQENELQITNLSELVLDVAPYANTSAQLQVTPPSDGPLPTLAAELEVSAQNAVLDGWNPGNSAAVFLPVGGKLIAYSTARPTELSITLDPDATAWSFGAWTLSIVVASNVPDESPAGYYGAVADCVNATQQIWEEITQPQQPPPSLKDLIDQALSSLGCAELTNKINEYLQSKAEQRDESDEAQRAADHLNDSQVNSESTQEEMVNDEEIRSDIIIR